MKKVTAQRMDIAFYLKLFPLKGHKDAYWKSKSIVCNKSIQYLEDNFAGKPIPKADCPTQEVDDNIKLGAKIGVTGTPTMILPDGAVYSGATDAAELIKMIDDGSKAVPKKKGTSKKTR